MEISTKQPKWHLTFDGHLLHQHKTFGGLADKSDESVELQHQTLKKLRDRHRRVSSFQRRSTCLIREMRRSKSKKIMSNVRRFNSTKQQRTGTKRKVDALERIAEKQQVKREKRGAYI